jgi:hypothetical protein
MRVAFEALRRRTDGFITDAVIFEIAPFVLRGPCPSMINLCHLVTWKLALGAGQAVLQTARLLMRLGPRAD